MTEMATPLKLAEELIGMREELMSAFVDEYNQGAEHAFKVTIAGLEAAFAKSKEMPEAKDWSIGLEAAIFVVNGVKDKFINVINNTPNTVTETNGEKSNG